MGQVKLRVKNAKSVADVYTLYFRLVSAISGFRFAPKELALLAHTAEWGTISTPPARDSFIELYGSSQQSINNMSSDLQRAGHLIKDESHKIRVNPAIMRKFEDGEVEFTIKVKIDGTE